MMKEITIKLSQKGGKTASMVIEASQSPGNPAMTRLDMYNNIPEDVLAVTGVESTSLISYGTIELNESNSLFNGPLTYQAKYCIPVDFYNLISDNNDQDVLDIIMKTQSSTPHDLAVFLGLKDLKIKIGLKKLIIRHGISFFQPLIEQTQEIKCLLPDDPKLPYYRSLQVTKSEFLYLKSFFDKPCTQDEDDTKLMAQISKKLAKFNILSNVKEALTYFIEGDIKSFLE